MTGTASQIEFTLWKQYKQYFAVKCGSPRVTIQNKILSNIIEGQLYFRTGIQAYICFWIFTIRFDKLPSTIPNRLFYLLTIFQFILNIIQQWPVVIKIFSGMYNNKNCTQTFFCFHTVVQSNINKNISTKIIMLAENYFKTAI